MARFPSLAAQFRPASDRSLLVYFGDRTEAKSDAQTHNQQRTAADCHEWVRKFVLLLELQPIPGVRNLHPGYSSVLVNFDALKMRHDELQEMLSQKIEQMREVALPKPRELEIPVCYGGEFGPDLQGVAELHGLTAQRVVEMHAGCAYTVYFLGFVPGFAYLGELPKGLQTPRLPTPRKSVPAGSVGIAKNQTGVYPISTPGGWRLLGRTPLVMFQPMQKEMSLLSIGDRVRFVPISRETFSKMERA